LLRNGLKQSADGLCQHLDCFEHLARYGRMVWNEDLERTEADDRAGLWRPSESGFINHMPVTLSIHRIDFKPDGDHVVGCSGRIG
jgi:hypothetical protein